MDVPRVTGAAQRRKQRRMRSWWRHEQVSIAAAVATALHHSAQRGGGVARRPTGREDSGNKGTRPGVLKDPEPQLLDAVLAYRAAGEPLVATPLLAAPAAEGIDSSSLRFLTASALEARRREEEEKEKKRKVVVEVLARAQERVRDGLPLSLAEDAAWRQWSGLPPKQEKRRKRRRGRSGAFLVPPLFLAALVVDTTVDVSLRHVVDVPVVRFVLFPQVLISSNDEICAAIIYYRFKLIGKGRSEQWEVFLYCDKTIKMTVTARKCCPGVCLRLAFVVSASVLHPTWQRITPSMSCACLLSVAWDELDSGRSTLEREVQWDFRVHGSSCGTCRDVLHSPLTVSTIDVTTTVVALYSASADCTGSAVSMCSAGACVAMSCDGGCFTPDGAYDSLWRCR